MAGSLQKSIKAHDLFIFQNDIKTLKVKLPMFKTSGSGQKRDPDLMHVGEEELNDIYDVLFLPSRL